jgi:hypothetical protein
MATKRDPPKTALALLDGVLGDSARTGRALLLMLGGSLALTLALAPILAALLLFGTAGAVAVGGMGTVLTTGLALRRRRRRPTGRPHQRRNIRPRDTDLSGNP